jgi:HD-like signal output (HDOD) protein
MSQDIHYRILEDHRELSSLPHVLVEVIKVSRNPDSSVSDISAVILKDPALTAKILRVVNSPYYGRIQEVTTVNQAVVTLGMRAVTAIALSASVYDKLNAIEGGVDRKRFWRHSLETAIASRMIADEVGYEPLEEAFVAGLLHEIGILILEASFPDEYRRMWKLVEAGESLVALEQQKWGTTHSRSGQFLLDQWGVPKHIGAAVGMHHKTFDQGDKSDENRLAQIVNLANQLSKFRAYMMPPPAAIALKNKDIIASNLDLSNAALGNIEERLIAEVIKESSFLEIDIGSVEELLVDSNRLLYRQYLTVENLLRENRKMQMQIAQDQSARAAFESLKTFSSIMSKYINNATAAIQGRAQILDLAVSDGRLPDEKGVCSEAARAIIESVSAITLVLDECRRMGESGPDDAPGNFPECDLEERIQKGLEAIEAAKTSR